ncbi:PHD Zn-finger protein [Handroanthus impetiginosus]|uniref:PHD Zn-finger protein n=1 Tax=Handroanthus impetiginosus TaxID=429701 RepID=A0A2G9G184_9LAMI|nr:PHD Zn-finger protein [Handroanthus impetiginosus]
MGLVNGTQELGSNLTEQSKTSENLAQYPKCESLTSNKCEEMDCERLVTEMADQKEISGAQIIEKKLVSREERSDRIEERGQNSGESPQNVGMGKQESVLENVKILSVENLESASQNGLSLENMGIAPGRAFFNPGNGRIEVEQIDMTNDCGHLENEGKRSSRKSRKRKAKLEGPVTSSWSLRSKSQEKLKASEPNDTEVVSANAEKKRRRRKKKQLKKNTVNEFSRTRTHLRYLLHRIKYEQSLIDAYSSEGWKGQSLEKLKPEKELQRAKSHILRYKLKIRALFQRLDLSLAVGKLPESLFDSHGEIDSEDIFCAKCGSKDLTLDNDIILCDGACERGFHQFCLQPPLLKEDIPPGDEGWLCPGCDCKVDCIEMLKDFQGTKVSVTDSWEKIFPEAAAAASGKKLDDGSGSSSDDSEDDDYDPDKPDTAENVEGDESSSDESNYFSASDDLGVSTNNEKHLGLPSDDSEDDDFDPSATDPDKQVQDSSSSDFTSDSEDLDALLEDETVPDKDLGPIVPSADHEQPSTGSKAESFEVGRIRGQSLKNELSDLMEAGAEPVSGKRHIERLDYKKLHDETYGNSSSDSSDEDFGDEDLDDEDFDDATPRKRAKTDSEKTESKSLHKTPIAKDNINTKDESENKSIHKPKRIGKNDADVATNGSSAEVGSASTGTKKSAPKRLGEAVTQRLYASFNQNQYPDKAVKVNLAEELGLTVRQVAKWFENARWSFHHRPRAEPNSDKPPEPQPTIDTDNTKSNQNVELHAATSAQEHITEATESVVANTSGENSGTRKTRKKKGKLT